MVHRQPAGVYLRGLPSRCSVGDVQQLYVCLARISPTLRALPPAFTLQQVGGLAVVQHDAFQRPEVIRQVLEEIGRGGGGGGYRFLPPLGQLMAN